MVNSTPPSAAEYFPNPKETLYHLPKKIVTGISSVDNELVTLSSKFATISGQPSTGKTALCTTIATNQILQDKPALFVAAELGEKPMLRRFASCCSNICTPSTDVSPQCEEEVESMPDALHLAFQKGIELFSRHSQYLYLFDCSSKYGGNELRYVERIAKYAKAISDKHGTPCMIICDYLQYLLTREKTGTSTERYDAVSCKLAKLAQDNDFAVIAASSANRDGSMRGSGQIAYDSDISLELYLDEEECDKKSLQSMQIRPMIAHIKKNRDGRAEARVKLDYRPASHRFVDRGADWR